MRRSTSRSLPRPARTARRGRSSWTDGDLAASTVAGSVPTAWADPGAPVPSAAASPAAPSAGPSPASSPALRGRPRRDRRGSPSRLLPPARPPLRPARRRARVRPRRTCRWPRPWDPSLPTPSRLREPSPRRPRQLRRQERSTFPAEGASPLPTAPSPPRPWRKPSSASSPPRRELPSTSRLRLPPWPIQELPRSTASLERLVPIPSRSLERIPHRPRSPSLAATLAPPASPTFGPNHATYPRGMPPDRTSTSSCKRPTLWTGCPTRAISMKRTFPRHRLRA
mmetsp:Transcript_17991/g.42521  ORF Transcript_17991/g.42521 Transcript_17991/m.42521 type:complete len:282 (-) Transcript_17991:224-1069(-)